MRLVIALGGNAILRKDEPMTPEREWVNVRTAARLLAKSIKENDEVVITHGNGPQVGYLTEIMERSMTQFPVQSLNIAGAMTQGWLGFMIAHALDEALGHRRPVVAVVTRTLVSLDDPEFSSPSKFIGPYYSAEEAEALSKRFGWTFRRDPRGGFRRVVPSPKPIDVLERDIIERLAREGAIVVSVGGGGVPVAINERGELTPVDGVVDKDLASSVLASRIGADKLVILTDVRGVAVGFGTPAERWLSEVSVNELEELYRKGEFPPGSMGPKVLAAINFVKATGKPAAIGDLDDAPAVIAGTGGTQVRP